MLRVTLLLLAIITAQSYSIQGNWTLINARNLDIGNEAIVLNINDFVFRGQSILQRLTFSGCQKLLLQAQFSENQLFINGKTYYTQPIPNLTCSAESVINQIYSSLNTVFFFEINIDTLMFNDPYGSTVMSFKRIVRNGPANITGIWNMNQFGNTQTSLSIQISNTQITLCQGNLVFNYEVVQAKNLINLTPVTASCSSQNLTNAVKASKYFRLNNGILNLYDSTITLTAGLVYSNPFDPAKPIFSNQSSAAALSSQNQTNSGPISSSNLAGTWYISSLFNIPLTSTPYNLIFASNNIRLVGGCANYTFNYTINSTTQIINILNTASQVSSACRQSDDQLYISGVTKMYKYIVSTVNGASQLSIYDQSGNIGYALRSNQAIPKTAASASNGAAPSVAAPLSPGTYLFLLLSRRDLPRVLVNVTANTLSYKSCNKVLQTFTPTKLTGNKGSIKFTGGPSTNTTCLVNNDQIYYGTLNLAASYSFNPSKNAIIFSNQAGIEVATLSMAS